MEKEPFGIYLGSQPQHYRPPPRMATAFDKVIIIFILLIFVLIGIAVLVSSFSSTPGTTPQKEYQPEPPFVPQSITIRDPNAPEVTAMDAEVNTAPRAS